MRRGFDKCQSLLLDPHLCWSLQTFARCSRVYWSTTDARKRCVYTCKIVECRPPAVEPDINSTVEHDENRTIAHSPTSFAGWSLIKVSLELYFWEYWD